MTASGLDNRRILRRGLVAMAGWMVVACLLVLGGAMLLVFLAAPRSPGAMTALLATSALTLSAALLGFLPLRVFLAGGVENLFAGWLAAMLVRIFLCLIGLLVLVWGLRLPPVVCALTLIGQYLVLLGIEAAAVQRLIVQMTRKAE